MVVPCYVDKSSMFTSSIPHYSRVLKVSEGGGGRMHILKKLSDEVPVIQLSLAV
jgi:hypothetical protein